jgi:hypothetical protein
MERRLLGRWILSSHIKFGAVGYGHFQRPWIHAYRGQLRLRERHRYKLSRRHKLPDEMQRNFQQRNYCTTERDCKAGLNLRRMGGRLLRYGNVPRDDRFNTVSRRYFQCEYFCALGEQLRLRERYRYKFPGGHRLWDDM